MVELLEDRSCAIVRMDRNPPDRPVETALPLSATQIWADLAPGVAEDRLPRQLISRYVKAAVRRAMTEHMNDGRWYAEITLLPGVWAEGDTESGALAELESVTEAWLLLKIEDHDRDIPILETLNLNRL